MIPEDRKKAILDLLNEKGYLSVEELAKAVYVSIPTIRRDLSALEKEGSIKRTHGGASPNHSFSVWPFALRNKVNLDKKRYIGKLAAELVEDGDSIFIDSSTTCLYLVKALEKKRNLNVMTNSIPIAQTLAEYNGINVECPGGRYYANSASFFNSEMDSHILQRSAGYCFMTCSGFDLQHGFTGFSNIDIPTKRAFHQQAKKTVMLMDSSKIGKACYYHVLTLDEIDILVTDRELPEEYRVVCEEKGIEVICGMQ